MLFPGFEARHYGSIVRSTQYWRKRLAFNRYYKTERLTVTSVQNGLLCPHDGKLEASNVRKRQGQG